MEAVLNREVVLNKNICRFISVSAFVIFTALGAFVRIPLPFTPVPITLQTFFVLISGALLGWRMAGVVQLSYIILGVLGLPIFTGAASGVLYLFGPTAGYLIGFIVAVLFIGSSVRFAKNSPLLVFSLFCVADFILLLCGTVWLKVIAGLSFDQAVFMGFLPFVPGDLIKAAAATAVFSGLRSRMKEVL